MTSTRWKSVFAVLAGALFAIVVTTLIDIVLHATHVYPPLEQPIDSALAALASCYRLILGVAAGWITARLAPSNPLKHALVLGALGAIVSLIGVVTTWNMDLGPKWYPISLVFLAIPQAWVGAKLATAGRAA